ncbi:MAG TPA: hypothetical protein VMM77_04110 [Gemmatimonadaceae bacterium]|nr:hypothetical protein [Gemmatimonadaceae bacterium]
MRRQLALFLLFIAGLSCGGDSPTGSSTFTGTFDLVTVDGTALPRLEFINMTPDTLFLTGAELRVLIRGRLSHVQRTRWHTAVAGPRPEESDTLVLSYRESGSQLLIDYPVSAPYGPYTDTATLDTDAVVVRTHVRGLQPGVIIRDRRYQKR